MNNSGIGYVGQTSRILTVLIQGADGKGLTGLVYSGVTCYATKNGAASSVRTLVTMTAGTWTSLGFKELDATHMPGLYQFGAPNADQDTAGEVVYVFSGTGIGLATYSLLVGASNALAASVTVDEMQDGLATEANVNAKTAAIKTTTDMLADPSAAGNIALQKAHARENLLTGNGKRGHKQLIDPNALTSTITDTDGTTPLSVTSIVFDDNGNIIVLGGVVS